MHILATIGDGSDTAAESLANHQHIERGFLGGVIRIEVDRRAGNRTPNTHPAGRPCGACLVPADNPFVSATTFNGLTVEPADVGLDTLEEINLVTKGGNLRLAASRRLHSQPGRQRSCRRHVCESNLRIRPRPWPHDHQRLG